MGKFIYALMTAFVIELALYLFAGVTHSRTTLFNFIINPATTSAFYVLIYVSLIGLVAAGIIASAYASINIYGAYATIAAVLLGFAISIVHLSSFVYGQLTGLLSSEWTFVITAMITATFGVTYMMAVGEWIRSNT